MLEKVTLRDIKRSLWNSFVNPLICIWSWNENSILILSISLTPTCKSDTPEETQDKIDMRRGDCHLLPPWHMVSPAFFLLPLRGFMENGMSKKFTQTFPDSTVIHAGAVTNLFGLSLQQQPHDPSRTLQIVFSGCISIWSSQRDHYHKLNTRWCHLWIYVPPTALKTTGQGHKWSPKGIIPLTILLGRVLHLTLKTISAFSAS